MQFDALIADALGKDKSDDLAVTIGAAVREIGFDFIAINRFGRQLLSASAAEIEPLLLTYPDEWVERYIEKAFWRIDATVRFSASASTPIWWDAINRTTASEQWLFSEAHDMGIQDGLTVPIHHASGEMVQVTFSRSRSEPLPPETLYRAQALASMATLRCQELRGETGVTAPPELTERERECLVWAAIGKSSWDIGQILSISADTVNFHTKNAMRKLDCSNRVLAVVKAIRFGLIRP